MLKKLLNITLVAIFAMSIFSIAGCKEKGPNPEQKSDYWDKDGNGIPDWQEEEITLTFATWQYTDDTMVTIDTEMAAAFTELYPNIKIQFETRTGQEYDFETNLLTLLESNELPDVFLVRRLETMLPNNMLADITEYYDNDPDTQYIFKSLQNSGIFNGKRYAVPTYIYPQFWVVNKTLLKEKNISIPTYSWTWNQMEAIAKQANDETKHYIGLYGRQGYYGEGCTRAYLNELPKILKMKNDMATGLTWAGWAFDGSRFNFDDPVFQEAMNSLSAGLSAGWAKTGLTTEQKSEYYHDEAFVPTTGGKVAIWEEASWSFKDEKDKMEFEWDIYPGPSGVSSGNTDIAGVSSLCKHKQAAYQFLKWMSYSEEGILARFRIYTEQGNDLYQQGNNYPYPIADYGIDENGVNKIWSSIPYGDTAPGLVTPEFLEALRNGAFTLNKEVCGWDNVDYSIGGYFKDIYDGTTTFAAVKQSIQETADEKFKETRDYLLDMLR